MIPRKSLTVFHISMPARDEATPRLVEAITSHRIVKIAGGWRHTLASDDSGRFWAWGWNKVPRVPDPVLFSSESGGSVDAAACAGFTKVAREISDGADPRQACCLVTLLSNSTRPLMAT